MVIKVVGTGCARCAEAENVVSPAVRETGGTAAAEKVTDLRLSPHESACCKAAFSRTAALQRKN